MLCYGFYFIIFYTLWYAFYILEWCCFKSMFWHWFACSRFWHWFTYSRTNFLNWVDSRCYSYVSYHFCSILLLLSRPEAVRFLVIGILDSKLDQGSYRGSVNSKLILTVWIVDATHMSVVIFARFCLRLYDSLSLVFWIQR